MERLLEELGNTTTIYIAVLWAAGGLFLVWKRGIGSAVFAPLAVAAAIVLGGGLDVIPSEAYAGWVVVSVTASMVGGYTAIALNPHRARLAEVRAAATGAERRLSALEIEISEIEGWLHRTDGAIVAQEVKRAA